MEYASALLATCLLAGLLLIVGAFWESEFHLVARVRSWLARP